MKSSKLRRALAVFLSAAMLILAVPFTGITAAAEDGWTEVSDADELLAALAGTGNIRFTSDISMEELSVNRSCVIDLDNHTLTITHGSVSTNACEGLTIDTADPVTFKNGTILISPGGKRVAMVINEAKSILTLEKIHLKGNTRNCGLLATNSVRSEKITFINSTIENTNNIWSSRSVDANSSTFYFKGDVNFISINNDACSILGPGVTTINIYGNVTTNTWFKTCNYENSTLNFYGGSIKTTGTGGKLFEYTTLALGDADKMKLYSDSGKTTPINDVTTLGTSVSAAYSTYDHTHNWTYSANENVITATCGAGGCPISPSPKLTLKANDVEYTGSPYTGASVSADYGFPVTVTKSDIQYEGTGTTTYEKSATAPTNLGSYVAYVTAGGETASKPFSINAPTMSGISAANVTKTYDGTAYGIEVTNVPEGAVVKYGESPTDCTLDESPKYTNAGTYEIFYKVTKENYADYIDSASLIIDRADYTGEMTAEKEILAGEVNENLTVALPEIPENMSYDTPTYDSLVTSASVTDGVLTFSTDNTALDSQDYTITVPVVGVIGANYNDYSITVTLTAKACPHTNKETDWTTDENGHWHKCPDCTAKVDYEEHTPAEAVKKNVVDPTCTVDGSYDEVVYCSVCDYEISRTPKTTDATGHSFTNYISNGDADCLNDGTKTAECDNSCGETDTVDDVDSKTGHKWSTKYTYDKNYHWHECEHTNCPVTDNADKDGHGTHISSGEATEDNDEHCTVCGYVINPPLDHLCGRTELTFVPEVPETCTTDGTKAHYECRCGKLYSDKNAAVEVTAADLRIPAHHVWSESWSNDETQHYHLCTVCGEKNDAAAHTFADIEVITEPTEDSEGLKLVGCTVCGYEKNVTIPKLDHVHSYSTQKHDSEYHWNECRCGEISKKALHTFGDWKITKLATPTADGTKERTCDVCGYVQTGAVKYIPDDDEDTGDINNTTDPDENACHSDVELTKPEIIEKIELTPEELTAVENGEDINVYLEVVDNTANVSESDKDLTESVLGSDDTVAMYLDISLFKQVGENAPIKITNTNGAITIVFEMPEEFINHDSSVERTYSIVRVHDGEADKINGVFDAASRKFKFGTDKFSSYAIAYTDTATTDPDSNPDPNPDPNPKPNFDPNPNPSPAPSSHTHSYKLKYDETGHWEQCSCGDKKDFEEHKFGEWEVVQEPTNEKDGLEKHTCTICGYSETAPFISVEPSVGVTAEEDSIDMTSKKAAFFIPVIAIAALGAVAFVLRRKARK